MKAAKALKEKGDTPEELLRSIKENEAAVAEAQRVVAAWKAIVGEKSRREEASKAEVERIERKAAEERERADKEEKKRIEAEKAEEEARVEAERKAEEERKTKEEERKERDENGQPFVVSSDGTTTFGEITEDTGLTAAPIKLSEGVADKKGNGYGLRHIEARHGDQIRKAGFSSVEEFVKYVASNYDKHNIKIGKKRANGVETYLIQAEDEHSNMLYVELSKDGSYWNVNSGGIFRKGYAEKKKDVGQNTEHPTSATTLQDKSFVQTDKDNGSQSADTHSDKQHPSADKGTTLAADQQTSDKESTKKVADSEGENTLKAKIEAASADVNTDPTEAQKEAGNYKKGHVQVGTFDITIEQPEGSIRRGTDADGKKWESKMHNTYGYFRGTEGVDGDHIDVFLSNDIDGWNGRKVFVVDQYNPDGTFDEHKVMLGFNDMDEAKSDYLANYEKGWENGRRIDISSTNLEDFEKWIGSSHRKTKPFSEYSSVNKETVATDKGSEKPEKKQEKQSVFDKAKEIADKEEKKRKAEADSVLGQATRAVGKKKKVNLFKYTVSEKNSNSALRGVHYANGYAYASDGYILFKEKADYPKEWEGSTRDKDGNLIDGKYPDTEKAIHRLVHIPDKEVESLPSKEALDFAITASKKLKGKAIPVAIDGIFFNAVNLKKFLEAVASKGMDKVVYRHPMLYATNGKDEIVMMPTVNTLEGALDIADRMESAGLPKEQIDAWKAHIEAADKKMSFDDFKKAVENAKKEGDKAEAEKQKVDKQGNPIDAEGRLITEKVEDISDLSDDDFNNPTRSVELPKIPKNVDDALGANGRPVIIKKNIFEKNGKSHGFTPKQSRKILGDALYNPDIVGQSQPSTKKTHWVAIKVDEKSPITILEVNDGKDNVEVVGWYTLDARNLERIKRQAEREGGELLVLSPKDKVESLPTPTSGLPTDKGSEVGGEKQEAEKKRPAPIAERIEDVGEKIGDARKDVWKEIIAGIKNKKQGIEEALKKSSAGKLFSSLFDEKELLESGVSNEVVTFISAVKGSLGTKPRSLSKLKMWINKVLHQYDMCEQALENWESVKKKIDEWKYYSQPFYMYRAAMAVGGYESGRDVGNAELWQIADGYSDGKSVAGQWCVRKAGAYDGIYKTYEEAAEALKKFAGENAAVDGKGKRKEVKLAIYKRRTDGTMFIAPEGKPDVIIQDGFKTLYEASAYKKEHYAEMQERYRTLMDGIKPKFNENRERRGRDWRGGKDVSAEDFREAFDFRGVEFGNWMQQKDRRQALNECYDSLMDLAMVCGVSPKALSLGGKLAMAFGARGVGKFNAHYEPDKVVINLTKTKGAGSLAHEWFHAIDNYFNMQGWDEFATESTRNVERKEMAEAWKDLVRAINGSDYFKRSDKYARLKGSRYWIEPTELGARAFAVWVENRLSKYGTINDYLANNPRLVDEKASDAEKKYAPYPFDKDADWMDEKFGRLFEVMQERVDEETGKHILYSRNKAAGHELTAEERELRDNLVERMRKGGLDVVTDSEEMQRVIDTENERTRNMFVGEKGATEADKAEEVSTRLDNLSVARRMEEAGKDAKAIKMATGWERGTDGKWRYETSDIKPKPFEEWMNKKNLKLGDIIDSDSGLFEMYPELKDFKVTRGKGKSTNAAIYTGLGKIEINFSKFKPYMSIPSNREKIDGILHRVINHDIQHAIQDSEGFAQGVSPNAFRPDAPIGKLREMEEADGRMVERYNAMSYTEKALGEGVRLKERILENRKEYNALASKYRFGMDGYTRAAGEVEARNTEKRIGMTEEERRASLASETEDVAREDQILLGVDNADGEMNTGSVREHRVYHGSGADFDAFDHSHMGEGEGAQAYGWGTYVTEVEGIGRTYAIQNTTKHNDALRALQHDVDAISDQLDRHRDDLKYDEEQLKRANEWRAEAELDYELFKDEAEKLKEKYGESSPKYRNHLFNDIYTDEMKRAQSSVKSTEESIQYRKEKIAELEKALKDKQAEIDELPKEFPRHLYTVEIPDDNGSNYLDWNGHPAESLLKDVGSFLESEGFERVQDSPARYEKGESTVVLNPNATGADLYAELQEALGSDKKASQALAELGCIGIKYPADNMRGGRKDGAKNYVIFNENDAKITDHVRFLRTAGGEVYGLVKGGRIYLDPKVATSETAVHEYTHLWGDMLRRKDSEQWSHTVKELKNSVLWEEVKELYPELKTDDEIADEVLSTFSGRRGAERLREEARRVADGDGGVFTKAKAIEALERVKEAIARFWEGVARMFGINRYRSAEELADMAMKDLLDSKNPMKDESGMRKRGEVGETLATSGTYFSGGGLLEAGLKGVIDPKVAVEFSEKIAGVYADNHGNHIVVADVRDVDPKKLVGAVDGGEVQYFHASPVCKNFSKAKREGGEVELDKETALSTAEFIAKTRPKVVTIENVKGYRNSEALKIITDELTRQGYDWDADVYNTADYGGYTKRERLIVRAKRDGKLPPKPEKFPEELRKKGWYSAVEDLIPHLEEKKTGVPQGTDERLKNSGIDYRTIDKPLYVFGRGYANKTVGHAFADELLPTLTTGGGDIIIMPDGRVLKASPRVLARVTGLPDTYKMPETDQLSHTIVGNGIPTQLTEGVIAPLLDNAIPSAERATKRESVFDVADRVSQNLEERTRAMAVKKANDRFNEELELQVKGELEEGHVYKLGMPSEILLSTGVPNLPIELSAKQLSKKAADRGHRFDVKDIANLPQAIQAPIAVFEYGNKDKSQNLIVEIERDGKKFVVGIHFNQNRRGIVVNDIRGLFNKDSHEWLNWISQGKLLYADKEKIQALMDKQRTNLAEVNYLNLDDVAKKVKDFENPKLFDGKISEVDKKGSDSIDRSVRENPKNEDKPRYSRKPGESIFDYASRVSEDVDRSVRERVSARDEYEKKVKSKGFQTKEALQNSMLGLQEFMSAIDHASGNKRYIEDIPDFENPILGENRLSSVNKEEMHQVAKTQFKPLMSAVAKLSGNGKESGELYDYMFAKHGLERDAVMRQREAQKEFDKYQKANPKGTKTIGDFVASLEGKDYAGLTALTAEDGRVKSIQSQIDAIDEQMKATDDQLLLRNLGGQKKRLKVDLLNAARDAADDIRKAFESNPSHDRSDINELWSRVNEVNGNTLRKLYESGLLTKEAYNDISSMYTNYIPMRGFDQTTSADAYAYLTHGDSAFNAPIKTAKGRSSKADNPIAYMQAMAESAIMQGNRNVLVKQKMLNFVRNHPSDLASVSDVWLQYDSVADEWKPFYAFGRESNG